MGAVVDSSGALTLSWLSTGEATDVSVVASWGPSRSDHAGLLEAALGTPAVAAQSTASSNLQGAFLPDPVGVGRSVLAIDVEVGPTADGAQSAAVLGAALADVILLSLPFHDVDRVSTSGIGALAAALTAAKDICQAAAANEGPEVVHGNRTLLICIRDWDEEATLSEVLPLVSDQIKTVGLDALCDFELLPLSSRFLAKEKYEVESTGLQSRLKELLSSTATENPAAAGDLGTATTALWEILEPSTDVAVPAEGDVASNAADREMMATVQATTIMASVYDKYLADVRALKQGVEAGRVLGDFGTESTQKLARTLSVYDSDAQAIKNTKAFARKRAELKDRVEADLHTYYTKQVLLLRELAYEKFKQSLSGISVSSRVEKDVRRKITEATNFFTEKADGLKARDLPWRSDIERRELVAAMNDNATERLQLARLQGSYTPGNRAPIALGVHWLHPHPFGKDSRFEKLSVDDYVQYDPQRAKMGGIGRLRPFSKGTSYDATDGVGFSSEFDMIYSDSRDSRDS